MTMFMGPQPTEEQLAQMQHEYELAVMRNEEAKNTIRRFIAEDLSFDQLEALLLLVQHIANSQNPLLLSNFYEGIITGAMSVRDLVFQEDGFEGKVEINHGQG